MTPYQRVRHQRNELLKALQELKNEGALVPFSVESINVSQAKVNAMSVLKSVEDQQCTN